MVNIRPILKFRTSVFSARSSIPSNCASPQQRPHRPLHRAAPKGSALHCTPCCNSAIYRCALELHSGRRWSTHHAVTHRRGVCCCIRAAWSISLEGESGGGNEGAAASSSGWRGAETARSQAFGNFSADCLHLPLSGV